MSRIGKKPVVIAEKVKVSVKDSTIHIEGPKGKFMRHIESCIDVKIEGSNIIITRKSEDRKTIAIHGLARSLIQNMVVGVSKGFSRTLEIVGVGYRAQVAGNILTVNVGHCHPIAYVLPAGVTAKADKTTITLESADKQVLGEACAIIRSFRPPEPYKGKGIKYAEEHIRRKEGKKMVA